MLGASARSARGAGAFARVDLEPAIAVGPAEMLPPLSGVLRQRCEIARALLELRIVKCLVQNRLPLIAERANGRKVPCTAGGAGLCGDRNVGASRSTRLPP